MLCLLLAFVIIGGILEFGIEWLEHALEGMKGLLHFFQRLKGELLVLGALSLLLSLVEVRSALHMAWAAKSCRLNCCCCSSDSV